MENASTSGNNFLHALEMSSQFLSHFEVASSLCILAYHSWLIRVDSVVLLEKRLPNTCKVNHRFDSIIDALKLSCLINWIRYDDKILQTFPGYLSNLWFRYFIVALFLCFFGGFVTVPAKQYNSQCINLIFKYYWLISIQTIYGSLAVIDSFPRHAMRWRIFRCLTIFFISVESCFVDAFVELTVIIKYY